MGAKPSCTSDNQSVSLLELVDDFSTLPNELKWKIASFLSVEDGLLRMRLVCTLWNDWIIDYLSTLRMSVRVHVLPTRFEIGGGKPHSLKVFKKLPAFYRIASLNSFQSYDWWNNESWNDVIQFMSLPSCQDLHSIAVPSMPTDEQLTYFCERIRKFPDLQYIRLLVKNDLSFMSILDEVIQLKTLQSIKFHFPYINQLSLSELITKMFHANPRLHTLLLTGHGTYTDGTVENLAADLVSRPRRMRIILPVRPWAAHNLPLHLESVSCTQIGEAYYHMTSDAQYTLKIRSTPSLMHKISGHFEIEMKPSNEFDELKAVIVEQLIKLAESMGNDNARRRIETKVNAYFKARRGLIYDIKLDAIKLKRDLSLVRIDQEALQRVLNSYIQQIFHGNVQRNGSNYANDQFRTHLTNRFLYVSLSAFFCTLPIELRGKASTKTYFFGRL